MPLVELLAPAKEYLSAVAAVDYGADALYIGGSKFGARQAAGNSIEELQRVVDYAHRYGVRVHATLNTLLKENELAEAEQLARNLIGIGVDALIVQDMAFRQMNLPAELHASTQMCNRTPEGARFLASAGFARIILERALTLEEIRTICAATTAEVECFVHGAICVGYSGRCFLSRSMSSRSGNRGACSQPCRQSWDLTDGHGRRYLTGKHLLSVRDLNLSNEVGALLDAGVTALKIEGRLKDTNYIKNIVAHYRRAIDEALSERPHLRRTSVGESLTDFTTDPDKSFTRGASTWFFYGKQAGVASFDTPKSVGEHLGHISRIGKGGFQLDTAMLPIAGDGLCIVTPEGTFGTSVQAIEGQTIRPNRMEGIRSGAEVYRNFDLKFNRMLEHSRTRRVIPARMLIELSSTGVSIECTDCEGVTARIEHRSSLEQAKNPEANQRSIHTQALRSGETIFAVREVEIRGAEYFLPASLSAELRRKVLEQLLQARKAQPIPHRILPDNPSARYPSERMAAEENVTNSLAEAFYRAHGVQEIAAPLEFAPTTEGACVMRSSYCIRREIGQCLKENPTLRGDLYVEHGRYRYRLEFDCRCCEMSLIHCK